MANLGGQSPHGNTLIDVLDVNRYAELTRHADMLVNLWSAFKLACERGDAVVIRYHWEQIRAYSKAVSGLIKTLGAEDGANG